MGPLFCLRDAVSKSLLVYQGCRLLSGNLESDKIVHLQIMKCSICYLTLGFLPVLCSTPGMQGRTDRPGAAKPEDILLSIIQQELQRASSELGKLDPPP